MKPRNNKFDSICLLIAMAVLMAIAIVLKDRTISIPINFSDDNPAMSPTGTMSGTIG